MSGEPNPAPKPVPFKANVQNRTLQDVLNAIAQATPKDIWYYHERDGDDSKAYFVNMTSDF